MRNLRLPAWSLAGLAALPPFIWWLGWNPGFASSDTIDQWTQLTTENYLAHHPAIHTFFLDVISLDGRAPGLVTLLQLLLFGVVMAYAARWLVEAGVPTWLAVGAAWLLGLSPAIAPTTLALWKDVPFGLFFVWAWVELLALAIDDDRTTRVWPAVRLGIALGGLMLFRANGLLTVLPMLFVVGWVYRRRLRIPILTVSVLAVTWLLVVVVVYGLLDVSGSGIEPVTVFLPDVAASYNSEPESFTADEIELLEDVAPLSVWTSRYTCYDSTPLLFDLSFDTGVVTSNPDVFRDLETRVVTRDPDSVLQHRICAANFLYDPSQPEDAYFHRPEYDIPENTLGLLRDPISDRAFSITDGIWRWAEPDSRLWLTWRPAIVILPALAAITLFALVSSARRFLLPSTLFLIHLANVAATSPAQEFRYAYPLYLTGLLTVVLAWPVVVEMRRSYRG